jgi:hypothetical protein
VVATITAPGHAASVMEIPARAQEALDRAKVSDRRAWQGWGAAISRRPAGRQSADISDMNKD